MSGKPNGERVNMTSCSSPAAIGVWGSRYGTTVAVVSGSHMLRWPFALWNGAGGGGTGDSHGLVDIP